MRRLAPIALVSVLAVVAAACGGDDDTTSGSTLPTPDTTVPETTTTIDPNECFDVPAEAVVTTTAPPTTVVGPTVPPTTAPETTVPSSEVPTATTPGTVTPGIDEGEYADVNRPAAVRPCDMPSALSITVLRTGSGPAAAAGDTIYIDYTGIRSEDGQVFDNSYDRGVPLDFTLGQGGVIQGWDQGLEGAQAGSLIRLDIPAELAYGDSDRGDIIKAGDALTFLTEVRVVVPATTADDRPLDIQVNASVGATEVTSTDVVEGNGPVLEEGQTAIVHAMLVRGDNRVILTDTWTTNEPAAIALVPDGASLPGLVDGLLGAKVGSTRVITMPAEEAYGPDGLPSLGLPPATDLIIVAEIIGVI